MQDIDKIMQKYVKDEKRIAKENDKLIKSFGPTATSDLKKLMGGCEIQCCAKIKCVDNPRGTKRMDCGIFQSVHVVQWGTEGDCFGGEIYFQVKGEGQWYQVPYEC